MNGPACSRRNFVKTATMSSATPAIPAQPLPRFVTPSGRPGHGH